MSLNKPQLSLLLKWINAINKKWIQYSSKVCKKFSEINGSGQHMDVVLVGLNEAKNEIIRLNEQIIDLKEQSERILMTANKERKRRLFISTGFFGTWLAAAIIKDDAHHDDYLLITIDRQDTERNIDWAFKANSKWIDVKTIDHMNYYECPIDQFKHEWQDIDFSEVYSSHSQMLEFVKHHFRAKQYPIYEEGVATLIAEESSNENKGFIHVIQPRMTHWQTRYSIPIPRQKILEVLQKNEQSYDVPTITGDNNVVYLMPGIAHGMIFEQQMLNKHIMVLQQLYNYGLTIYLAYHPRVQNLLLQDVPQFFKVIPDTIPVVDFFIMKNAKHIKYIVGQYSTLLCNSEYLYGIEGLSVEGLLDDNWQNEMKKFQDDNIRSIRHVFSDFTGY